MIRLIYLAVFSIAITGCDGGSKKNALQLADLKFEIQKLEQQQSSYQKRFDDIYKNMKTINQQFPKLNENINAQLKALSNNNNALLKQININLDRSFKTVQKDINDFGNKLSKAGY